MVKVRLASHQIRRAQRYAENSTPPLRQHSRGHPYSPARYLQHYHATSQRSIGGRLGKKPGKMYIHCSLSLQTKMTQLRSQSSQRLIQACIPTSQHLHNPHETRPNTPPPIPPIHVLLTLFKLEVPSWEHRRVPPARPSPSHSRSRPHPHAHSYVTWGTSCHGP